VAVLSQIAHMAHETFFKSQMVSRLDRALEKQRAIDTNWRTVCRLVTAREGGCCRVCGKRCGGMGLLNASHHHHITYRSAGGADTIENLCLLCAPCHDMVHVKKTLRIEGDAELGLTFWRRNADGVWFVAVQELSPGVAHRD
jgi:hypothetical protein